jgi:hypothetical protein
MLQLDLNILTLHQFDSLTLYNFGLTPQGLEVFRTLYHRYPDESELLIYFIEGHVYLNLLIFVN